MPNTRGNVHRCARQGIKVLVSGCVCVGGERCPLWRRKQLKRISLSRPARAHSRSRNHRRCRNHRGPFHRARARRAFCVGPANLNVQRGRRGLSESRPNGAVPLATRCGSCTWSERSRGSTYLF
eukprot:249298-Chlamydomonas_euryale.AAC.2